MCLLMCVRVWVLVEVGFLQGRIYQERNRWHNVAGKCYIGGLCVMCGCVCACV